MELCVCDWLHNASFVILSMTDILQHQPPLTFKVFVVSRCSLKKKTGYLIPFSF